MNTEQELIHVIEENKTKYYRIGFAYTKNREDALDILYEAITKAFQHIDSLRNKQYLETWFYRILINVSISHIRRKEDVLYWDDLSDVHIAGDDPTDRDEYITLYSAIDKLSPKLRTVIILRFFEDMKLAQIADIISEKM